MTAIRTMVVWCLDWPVVATGRPLEAPVAVMHANRVVAASPGARSHGVTRGLRRREAQGRCPTLDIHDRDHAREARLFEAVIAAVETFTPLIEIGRPGTCSFVTRGPSRYFGGDESLARQVIDRVNGALGDRTTCRVGVADGAFAAALAARSGSAASCGSLLVPVGDSRAYLAPLPITTLDVPALTDVLLRLGIRQLGDLAALPVADVLGRFGTEGVRAHRLASGLDERPPDARRPPADMTVSVELDPPVDRVDQAAFHARTLALDFHAKLDARGSACTRLAIEAETEHGEHNVRLWRHEGALSAGAISERIRWQLDGWLNGQSARRPTAGLTRITLTPDDLIAAGGRQLGFWGGETAADDRAVRALTRVEAILGVDTVTVPEWRGGRGPADQLTLVPIQSVDAVGRSVRPSEMAPWPGLIPRPSPAQVHDDAVAVEVLDQHGHVVTVTGRGVASAPPAIMVRQGVRYVVASWAGPWLSDERWWDAGQHRRRARFQVVTADGDAHLLMLEQGHWSIEATYA